MLGFRELNSVVFTFHSKAIDHFLFHSDITHLQSTNFTDMPLKVLDFDKQT